MFDAISPRYELLNSVLSMGLDQGWRRRCINALELPVGSIVLDVACGTGDLGRDLDKHGLRPVGVDLSPGMLAIARAGRRWPARRASPPGFPLVLGDALSAPFRPGAFDGAVSGFALRNVVDLGALFTELALLVRPGGRIALLDLCEPEVAVLRAGHRLWCNYAIPLVGSLLSDAHAYRYLPRSFAYLPDAANMVGLLERAGFVAVERELLSAGASQLYVATRTQEARS